MRKYYDKLVRDKMDQVMDSKGIKYGIHTIDPDDKAKRLAYLFNKLDEEINELKNDCSLEETADVYTVFYALIKELGYNIVDVQNEALAKAIERGGFKEFKILDWVEEDGYNKTATS